MRASVQACALCAVLGRQVAGSCGGARWNRVRAVRSVANRRTHGISILCDAPIVHCLQYSTLYIPSVTRQHVLGIKVLPSLSNHCATAQARYRTRCSAVAVCTVDGCVLYNRVNESMARKGRLQCSYSYNRGGTSCKREVNAGLHQIESEESMTRSKPASIAFLRALFAHSHAPYHNHIQLHDPRTSHPTASPRRTRHELHRVVVDGRPALLAHPTPQPTSAERRHHPALFLQLRRGAARLARVASARVARRTPPQH